MTCKFTFMTGLSVVSIALWAWGAAHAAVDSAPPQNLFPNPEFRQKDASGKPTGYQFTGGAEFAFPGNPRTDVSDWGAGLKSTEAAGTVSQWVKTVDIANSKWYRFSFRGLPQENFAVRNGNLFAKVEFFGSDGKTEYDGKEKKLYPQIEMARKDLTVNGVRHANGAEAWQQYQLDFCLPFPQVHTLKLSVGFTDGAAVQRNRSDFFINDFSLIAIPDPPEATPANDVTGPAVVPKYARLIPLGGRWSYAAPEGENHTPSKYDASNANRLLYKDNGYSAPFAGNCSAWLRKGDIDKSGSTVQSDRKVEDNVVITFDTTGAVASLVMHTHGIPNHPTGLFPGLNPNAIVERESTYFIPLEPKENVNHIATSADNSNHALPMGPIGVAINGVVFYNPFDANSEDATDLMDRCCGHPNPQGQYHYHKYPICVNSPWADEGLEHSPLIGFAFDGYPVYGPYVSKDLMAKDATGENGLNHFNGHTDEQRGFHYQVTPGKFPYLIGGFWGTEDSRDKPHGPPGGMAGGRGGRNGPPGGVGAGNGRGRPPGGAGGPGFGPPPTQ